MSNVRRSNGILLVIALLAAACGAAGPAMISDADEPVEAGTETSIDVEDWDSVLDQARGTTVSFHMWGGSENINRYVRDRLAVHLQEHYGVTLEVVPLADTVEGVSTVINALQAGVDQDGSVDLIWINGANYFTMNQADALLTGWERELPNAELVDWEAEQINTDFGIPVEGMSPWSSTSFQLVYDSTRMDASELPRNHEQLRAWILEHPGRFTYPELPAFYGTRLVQTILYETTGGYEQWAEVDPDTFVEDSRPLWTYLQEIDASLWQGGRTYPDDIAQLNRLFANGEIDFTITLAPSGIEGSVEAGELPDSARPFVLDRGAATDANFLGIPVNAANAAGAMVVAHAALDPDLQLAKLDPEVGWGDGLVIRTDRLEADEQAAFDRVTERLSPYGLPPEVLEAEQVPHPSPEVVTAIERAWDIHVRQGRPLPGS